MYNVNMESLCYKIADLTVAMEPRFELLKTRAEPYRVERVDKPDITVVVKKEAVQRLLKLNPHATPEECEYIIAGGCFYNELLRHDGFLLHASAVEKDGRAYLFSAPCGTGKSTHTNLWTRVYPEAVIINDDKPALRIVGGRVYAYGTPFSGKHDLSKNVRIPLQAIAFIERAEKNSIVKLEDSKEALKLILEQTIRPNNAVLALLLLRYMDELMGKTPIYRLFCNISEEAAITAYEGMREDATQG